MKFRKTKNSEELINQIKKTLKPNTAMTVIDLAPDSLNIIGTIAKMYVVAHNNIQNESYDKWKKKEDQLNKNIAKLDIIELFIWDQFYDWFTAHFKQDVLSSKDKKQLVKKGAKFAKKIITFFDIETIDIDNYGQLIFNYFWLHEVCGYKTVSKEMFDGNT